MKIDRSDLLEDFATYVSQGNGILIGDAGVGKSHLLRTYRDRFNESGGMCFLLPADRIEAHNETELKNIFGYKSNSFSDYLKTIDVKFSYGVVIIDALEKAGLERIRFFLKIVGNIRKMQGDRWRILCSLRVYDAKHMYDLGALFPRRKASEKSRIVNSVEGVDCQHFFVPHLNEADILGATSELEGFNSLYRVADREFRNLVSTPFNLKILEDLVVGGVPLSEMGEFRTTSQLLDRFWRRRVPTEQNRQVLYTAARAMVDNQTLSATRLDVVSETNESSVNELMSSGLIEWLTRSEQRLTFSHNILFDYAISVLLIEETVEGFRNFIAEEQSRAVFLRPSIEFFLERIWTDQKEFFWNIFWDLLNPKEGAVRLVGRLLSPAILLRNVVSGENLDPILIIWETDVEKGELAIQRVLQALHTLDVPPGKEELWADWCCRISERPSVELLFYLTRSLEVLLDAVLTRELKDRTGQLIGKASRKLLRWVLAERNQNHDTRFDRIGAIGLVPLVCKTVRTDPADSTSVLSMVLGLIEEEGFPIEYISRLCHNIIPLMEHAPAYAAMVYRVVFGKDEISDDQTVLRDGVMALTSNRRQDFRMCHYSLNEEFAKFFNFSPEIAVATAVTAGTAGVLTAHRYRTREDTDLSEYRHSFEIFDHVWVFLEDGCHIWGQSTHPGDAEEIGNALFAWIHEDLLSGRKAHFEMFLHSLQEHTASTFFWRQVFKLAAEFPELLVESVWSFATVSPFLHLMDVRYEMGNFIAVAKKRLSPAQLRDIEQAILDLPNLATEVANPKYFPYARDCMLKKIGREYLSATGRAYLDALDEEDRVEIPPPHTFNVTTFGYSEKEALREQGIHEDTPGYVEVTSINEKVRAYCNQWQNKRPDAEGVQQGLPLLREAWKLYNSDLVEIELLKNRLIIQCACCCEKLSTGVESPEEEAYKLCKEILLYCAEHPLPEPYDEMDQQFTYPSWSPAPRTEAAQGLPWLARFNSGDDADLLQAIERLSADPVPSVRYLLAEHLFRLAWEHEDTFWRLIETRSTTEKNTTVLLGLAESLRHVIGKDTDKACELLDHLVPAALADTERDNLMDRVIALAVGTYLHFDHEWGCNVIAKISDDPGRKPKAMNRAMLDAVGFITPTLLDDAGDVVRAEKARDWLLEAIPAVAQRVVRFLDEGDSEKGTELYHGLDTVVSQLYFPLADTRGGGRKPASTREQKRIFFSFIRPLLECVLDSCEGEEPLGLHAHTAHHFVEMLNLALTFDPTYVLHQARRVIEMGQAGNYQHDSLAIGEVVKLVESVLANHRGDIRVGDALNDLIAILDIFCDAGSTKALNLVWRLDEIFR